MTLDRLESVFDLARGFMESRVLLTAAEMDLFTLLRSPLSAPEVAGKTGADLRALTILMDALAAMGLLVKKEETYSCSPPVCSALSKGAGSILSVILHMAHLWRRWSDLTAVIRGMPSGKTDIPFPAEDLSAFIGAMDVVASPLAPRIVADIRPEPYRALLDVGGASGTYTSAFLKAVPEMRATLFDRPGVIAMARERLEKEGLLPRVKLAAGDFTTGELPAGHDLGFLSAVIHQNSPEQNVDLFSKIFRALNPGGRLVIRDHVMEPDRIHPRDGALFAVNMLLATAGGGTYTFAEIRTALEQAGFIRIRLLKEGEHMDALVEAFKPA